MSGFIGWVSNKSSSVNRKEIMEHMLEPITVQGVDINSIWSSKRVTLGASQNRKLASCQFPFGISTPEGELTIVLHGNIYNLQMLTEQLPKNNGFPTPKTSGDILIQCYLHWGKDFTAKLEGEYVLALWDAREDILLLARDHIGVKPLYIYQGDNGIIFSTDVNSFYKHPDFKRRLEIKSLPILLQPRLILPHETPIENMEMLPPASTLQISRHGRSMTKHWELISEPHTDNFEETVAKVRHLLRESVSKRYLQSNQSGSVAGMLSGGLDSTSVVGLANDISSAEPNAPRIESFCMNFDSNHDEFIPSELRPDIDTPYAEAAAAYFNIKHTTVSTNLNNILSAFPKTRSSRGLPAWGQFDASMYVLFEQIAKKHKVVLTGEIADEVFGGYPYFFDEELLSTKTFPWLGSGPKLSRYLNTQLLKDIQPQQDEQNRYNQIISQVTHLEEASNKEQKMREAFKLSMSGPVTVLLERMERMSSCHGVEVRFPFCDQHLLQYLWNIPWSYKQKGGTKGLLKEAMKSHVPQSTLERKKCAYPHLQEEKYDQYVLSSVRKLTDTPDSAISSLFDHHKLRSLLDQIESNKLNSALPGGGRPSSLLIHLLELEEWVHEYGISW